MQNRVIQLTVPPSRPQQFQKACASDVVIVFKNAVGRFPAALESVAKKKKSDSKKSFRTLTGDNSTKYLLIARQNRSQRVTNFTENVVRPGRIMGWDGMSLKKNLNASRLS